MHRIDAIRLLTVTSGMRVNRRVPAIVRLSLCSRLSLARRHRAQMLRLDGPIWSLSSGTHECQYGRSDSRGQAAPSLHDALQVRVQRRQQMPLQAIQVQRPCSAAFLAFLASAKAVVRCVEIGLKFDSRRLHSPGFAGFRKMMRTFANPGLFMRGLRRLRFVARQRLRVLHHFLSRRLGWLRFAKDRSLVLVVGHVNIVPHRHGLSVTQPLRHDRELNTGESPQVRQQRPAAKSYRSLRQAHSRPGRRNCTGSNSRSNSCASNPSPAGSSRIRRHPRACRPRRRRPR